MILRRGEHVNGVEEVEPVGVARQVEWQLVGIGIVAIGIGALGQRTGDEGAAIHLGVVGEVETDVDGIAATDGKGDGVALLLGARHQRYTPGTTKGYGGLVDEDLGEGNGLGACEVREAEA